VEAEELRRSRRAFDLAARADQRALDVLAHRGVERRKRIDGVGHRRRLAVAERAPDLEPHTTAEDRGAVDHRRELAHVPRPVVRLELTNRLGHQHRRRLVEIARRSSVG